ncbi:MULTISPECIES: methyltransferase family protein [unclassified Agarivorans]|uniref:methyltransferase family protein n=1 Tax=unclassified Agarivorans TaxID=2636026 RepID=UPI0026E35675|nr:MULTISPECIES: isoprenylcysteine carboxylmethyltransferase family protein [unclassified Agarivorans]MDO6684587.1 isoprenylcysteine carboxylmethyltransferase family protein [Agarivorans sp. 3_MG-2023]MDO6714752.1 isoprenylcysteine carboxylmethyltransferase family protein [Agarivorans sp. 2_MG-2023]
MLKRLQLLIPPPVWLLLSVGLAYLLATFSQGGFVPVMPSWLVNLQWPLVILASLIAVMSVWGFAKKHTTINPHHPERSKHLVINGLYRYSRNPMYLSLLLLLIAWCLHLQAWLSLLSCIMFIGIINQLQIKPEEKALKLHFSEQYLQYCRKVRRWL